MNERYIKEIVEHYGNERQKLKAIEELTELVEIIAKDLNRKEIKNQREHILEEIAEVMIMVEQLKLVYGFSDDEVSEMVKHKLRRTMRDVRIDQRFDKLITEYNHHDNSYD